MAYSFKYLDFFRLIYWLGKPPLHLVNDGVEVLHVEALYGDQRRPYLPQVYVVDGEDPEVGSPRRKPHLAPSLFYIRGVGGGFI